MRSLAFWASSLQRLAVAEAAAAEQIFRYLSLAVPDLLPHVISTLLHDAAPAAEKVIMTLAEQWKAEGEARGRAEGEARGRAEGLRRVLLHQLVSKFGAVPDALRMRMDAASEEQLLLWSERILSTDSLTAILDA